MTVGKVNQYTKEHLSNLSSTTKTSTQDHQDLS